MSACYFKQVFSLILLYTLAPLTNAAEIVWYLIPHTGHGVTGVECKLMQMHAAFAA